MESFSFIFFFVLWMMYKALTSRPQECQSRMQYPCRICNIFQKWNENHYMYIVSEISTNLLKYEKLLSSCYKKEKLRFFVTFDIPSFTVTPSAPNTKFSLTSVRKYSFFNTTLTIWLQKSVSRSSIERPYFLSAGDNLTPSKTNKCFYIRSLCLESFPHKLFVLHLFWYFVTNCHLRKFYVFIKWGVQVHARFLSWLWFTQILGKKS